MTESKIPHVTAWKIEKHPPLEWLVIWTDLSMEPSTAGVDAEAKKDLREAVTIFMAQLSGPERCFVYSQDRPDGDFV